MNDYIEHDLLVGGENSAPRDPPSYAGIILLLVYVALILWLVPLPAGAADPWDKTDKVLGGTALAASVMDWSQTRYIARHPEQYRELDHMLPSHPSVSQVDAHFAGSILIGAAIANWLPSDYRKWFLGGVTVIELGVVAHNHSIGLKMRF